MRVSLVLTHQCNLACSYCYTGDKFNRSMPVELGWKALKMAFHGPREETVGVSFFGGEPMLEFKTMSRLTRLATRLAERQGRRLELSLTTNATILTKKQLDFLRHYGFWVAVSIDGMGADHDRHRSFVNGRSSSELVWRNLEAATEELERLHVLMVLNPETIGGVPAALEQMYRLGVSRVSLLPNMEADWDQAARETARQVYHDMARVVFLSMATPEPYHVSPFADQHACSPRTSHCSFGVKDVAVSPRGKLYPCSRLVGTDTRVDVQVGTVDTGPLLDRVQAVTVRSAEKMSSCGTSGPCACVSLMPGDVQQQLSVHRFFAELIGDSVEAARLYVEELQMVAA